MQGIDSLDGCASYVFTSGGSWFAFREDTGKCEVPMVSDDTKACTEDAIRNQYFSIFEVFEVTHEYGYDEWHPGWEMESTADPSFNAWFDTTVELPESTLEPTGIDKYNCIGNVQARFTIVCKPFRKINRCTFLYA